MATKNKGKQQKTAKTSADRKGAIVRQAARIAIKANREALKELKRH